MANSEVPRAPYAPKRKRSSQARAKQRGKYLEKKTARMAKGHLHPGFDGDVWATDTHGNLWMYEVKSRQGYHSLGDMKSFLEQVQRYVKDDWKPGQLWGLVISGGKTAPFRALSPSGTFIVLPFETYMELRDR